MSSDVLTIAQAGHLADLISGVEHSKKIEWYPLGTDTVTPGTYVLRAFTNVSGGMYPSAADIRDAHVWMSGIMEHWVPVREILDALSNLDGHLGFTEPIATIS